MAETLTYAYANQDGVDVRVARIFNTFGPRMNENDGRVVSNFIMQSLNAENITIYGDGKQTRSFQYVHDVVDGLIALMQNDYTQPVNLGNPREMTIMEFAHMVRQVVNPDVAIQHLSASIDDPMKRKPDISLARRVLNWSPQYSIEQGINETVQYFQLSRPTNL